MTTIPDLITLARELIMIPSESSDPVATPAAGQERGVVEYLQPICRAAGVDHYTMEALPGRSNLVVRLPNPGAARLLIVAHMDTVSGSGMENPFSGELRDGVIFGRGACDDKGPLAAGLAAVLDLHRELGVAPAYDITFAASVDEECTMSGARKLAAEPDGWDLCLALEPTALKIIRAHKGVFRCRITTRGKAAHSSHPDKGVNAITGMMPIIKDLELLGQELKARRDPELGRATLAVTRIQGGGSVNTIPEQCEVFIDIRVLPVMTFAEVKGLVENCVGDRATIDQIYSCDGIDTDPGNPLIESLSASIRAGGGDPGPITASFATDCSHLHRKGPCIVWGPGSIHQAHQAAEYIEVAQLEQAYHILKDFLAG
ncbi:MAG: M20 family metallopeptidase [Desulfurivibrionaceae bacterium]|nr:M20 family metallopeptidase [Desulfobulbales bacterium]MDT8335947.1 M20 family metallopeptidase [Desulfurivibrionaceae bacterium]